MLSETVTSFRLGFQIITGVMLNFTQKMCYFGYLFLIGFFIVLHIFYIGKCGGDICVKWDGNLCLLELEAQNLKPWGSWEEDLFTLFSCLEGHGVVSTGFWECVCVLVQTAAAHDAPAPAPAELEQWEMDILGCLKCLTHRAASQTWAQLLWAVFVLGVLQLPEHRYLELHLCDQDIQSGQGGWTISCVFMHHSVSGYPL